MARTKTTTPEPKPETKKGPGTVAVLRTIKEGKSHFFPTPEAATIEQHFRRITSCVGHTPDLKTLNALRSKIDREKNGVLVTWVVEAPAENTKAPAKAKAV